MSVSGERLKYLGAVLCLAVLGLGSWRCARSVWSSEAHGTALEPARASPTYGPPETASELATRSHSSSQATSRAGSKAQLGGDG